LRGRKDGGCVTNNVQYKSNQSGHYESSLYNEYILIKKTATNAGEDGCWGRHLYILLVGMRISAVTMEISMEVPQKTKPRMTIQSYYANSGIYLKECKSAYNGNICTLMFIEA
jgi:hypothetical protein